uniref:Uncharacterized protein n=1 Tax=Romanomermis culicivorax TaxID=13658 RepID=A0A915JIB7_ROMCU
MATDMKHFQFTMPMPADSTASSYPQYVQLAFPNITMFVFETFTATPEDWTALFSLVDGEHTIVAADGSDVRYDNYGNPHHVAATYGPHLSSEYRANPTAISYSN